MNEKMTTTHDGLEVDLKQVMEALLQRAWIIALVSVICAILLLSITFFFITPQYLFR